MQTGFNYTGNNKNAPVILFGNLSEKDANRFRMSKSNVHVKNSYHEHDYFQIWYMMSGCCIHHINGADFMHSQGDMVIIPPYMGHYLDTSSSPEIELICVEFSEKFINDATTDIYENSLFNLIYLEPLLVHTKQVHPILHFSGESDDNIRHLLEELYQEYLRHDKFFSTLVRSNMTKLLTLIVREYESCETRESNELFAKYRTAIQDALKYIDNNFTQKIYLKDVCQKALMSASSFSYIFKRITGKTLIEYLNYFRVLRACELLCETNQTTIEIALDCGFRDAVNFCRVFKKIVGCQPSTYRKLHGIEPR